MSYLHISGQGGLFAKKWNSMDGVYVHSAVLKTLRSSRVTSNFSWSAIVVFALMEVGGHLFEDLVASILT